MSTCAPLCHMCFLCFPFRLSFSACDVLVLSYFALLCSLDTCSLSNGRQKKCGSRQEGKGEELEENREGETIIRIYCIEKKNLFSIKEKIKRLEAKNLRDRSNVDS